MVILFITAVVCILYVFRNNMQWVLSHQNLIYIVMTKLIKEAVLRL